MTTPASENVISLKDARERQEFEELIRNCMGDDISREFVEDRLREFLDCHARGEVPEWWPAVT
jgi:hypothetical protein